MSKTLLAATTDAANSDEFALDNAYNVPAAFSAPGLAGAEVGTVQRKSGAGDWSDLYVDGDVQEITATNSLVPVCAPGTYRVVKDASAAAVPVEVSTWADV